MTSLTIPVSAIDDRDRVRPVTPAIAEQFAEDMRNRGLRQPIEVARRGKDRWELVDGGHRLAAAKLLRWETIEAVVSTGTKLERRRDQLLAQLVYNPLTMLERAEFLAELKRVYQELYPESKAGGDRTQGKTQTLHFAQAVAVRAPWGVRTIQLAAMIGEKLVPEAAALLRNTPFEDNQQELVSLAKLSPKTQEAVAELLTRSKEAPPTVAAALAILEGRKQADPEAKKLARLVDTWKRLPKAARRDWVQALPNDLADELADLLAQRHGLEEAA